MECIGQGDLHKMIDRFKAVPPLYGLGKELCILFLAQMINAIEMLQAEDIAHRDLKPLNVMIDDDFNIKLIDFGEAKHINDPEIGEQPEEEEEKKSEKRINADEDDGDFAFGGDDDEQNSAGNVNE
jgi:serine/threonine protein kinase